jgi:hypothetical protein
MLALSLTIFTHILFLEDRVTLSEGVAPFFGDGAIMLQWVLVMGDERWLDNLIYLKVCRHALRFIGYRPALNDWTTDV